jgi:hypothetical protein
MRTYRQVRPNLIPFVDYHTNILLVFILILAFSSITKKNDSSIQLTELYEIVMTWNPESSSDVDLWSQDSAGNIVGFNRREGGQGSLFALKRDDLGASSDRRADGTIVKINEEIISIRGTKEGEYIVNGHCYRKYPGETGPLTVKVKLVKIKPFKEIIVKERVFNHSGDEETFFRFKFDKNGEVTETNELPAKIAVISGAESAEQ